MPQRSTAETRNKESVFFGNLGLCRITGFLTGFLQILGYKAPTERFGHLMGCVIDGFFAIPILFTPVGACGPLMHGKWEPAFISALTI